MTQHRHPRGGRPVRPHDHSHHDFALNRTRNPASRRGRLQEIMEMAEAGPKQFTHSRFQNDPTLDLVLNNRRTIRTGSRGAAVGKVQQALMDLGFPLPRFGADQDFGSETRGAVLDFQRHVRRSIPGFGVDGVVGPNTMEQLDLAVARLRLRKEVTDLTPAERIRFINALNEWETRGKRAQYVIDHGRASRFAHGNSGFLPWHRQFILNFESELNDIDDQVYLPYWDWTKDPLQIAGTPNWNATMTAVLGGDGTGPRIRFGGRDIGRALMSGPISHWRFINAAGNPTSTRLARSFNMTGQGNTQIRREFAPTMALSVYDGADFGRDPVSPSFRADLERLLHNEMHVWVGGHMSQVAVAPNDPAFFLHHAMVDKLWQDWQAANPRETYRPATRTGPAPGRSEAMRVRDLHLGAGATTVTPAATLDNTNQTDSFGKTGLNIRYV